MNPEAGFIEPMQSRVEKLYRENPKLSADEVIRMALEAVGETAPKPGLQFQPSLDLS